MILTGLLLPAGRLRRRIAWNKDTDLELANWWIGGLVNWWIGELVDWWIGGLANWQIAEGPE